MALEPAFSPSVASGTDESILVASHEVAFEASIVV